MNAHKFNRVLVVGGAGYVGAVLVPKLLEDGYRVRIFDLFLYGENVCNGEGKNPHLEIIKGDVRDTAAIQKALEGCDAVIHLACISNDPSFELDPELGRAINFTSFEPLVKASREAGVRRFIFASTSSVYGTSESPNVAEDHPLRPLTDYSKYKALCEEVLPKYQSPGFTTLILRPSTVCGWSPRLRLDLTVNLLTSHAVYRGRITVFGGKQKRPNIHIEDITDLYIHSLEYADEMIAGKIFNAGYHNHTVSELAALVKNVVQREMPGRAKITIETTPSDDNRSYHISSDKIARELGFTASRDIEKAVSDLVAAFRAGKVKDPEAIQYFNIKTMQAVGLK